ncbi:NlpC/P60 family protein [Mannheimia sp. AT1]|uniref:NlpC/P60 family protein n=1 Tax=Mannheimia cairinae TaxID=3025936 RepID=A0ABT5MQF3_9PAST|nr:NlpC/P60 family protein [Mannheimia cairinae]MDD0824397.1 NlpC/P60 family protein [Mannheimia cairinae]MDD0825498.1 NlpC/P60 family protein [Mannheimia cairinae]
MKKNLFATTFRPLCILTLAVFGGYTSIASASLSTKPATPSQIIASKAERLSKSSNHSATRVAVSANSNLSRINSVYNNWKGTRYRLGGTTKSGIDCSAFVREVMSKAFNKSMPRSTAGQRHVGRSISKADLRPGDLVFFRRNNHVGVYIGNGKFVHASSSRGVTTSSLSERYWSRNYTQSRRVI